MPLKKLTKLNQNVPTADKGILHAMIKFWYWFFLNDLRYQSAIYAIIPTNRAWSLDNRKRTIYSSGLNKRFSVEVPGRLPTITNSCRRPKSTKCDYNGLDEDISQSTLVNDKDP